MMQTVVEVFRGHRAQRGFAGLGVHGDHTQGEKDGPFHF